LKLADAISYPLRIVGDARSAAIEFVDTPAFFGQEIRALSSGTFDSDYKIIRWIDYWDGRSSLTPNTIASTYPADFRDSEQNADPAAVQAAQALQAAFAAGDAAAADLGQRALDRYRLCAIAATSWLTPATSGSSTCRTPIVRNAI
jgi:hypothetical protein